MIAPCGRSDKQAARAVGLARKVHQLDNLHKPAQFCPNGRACVNTALQARNAKTRKAQEFRAESSKWRRSRACRFL